MKLPILAAASLTLLVASTAQAQSTATADSLFRDATQRFQRGETKTACELFAASYKLDPSAGTLFDLAVCHEKDEQGWQARGEFLEFAERANRAGKPDIGKTALTHVTAIDARLPKILLTSRPGSNVDFIAIDGAAVSADQWAAPVAVDPAKTDHEIEFRGKGLRSERRHVAAGLQRPAEVAVPDLQPVRTALPPAGAGAQAPRSGRSSVTGLTIGGVGVAALAVGAVFGGLTFAQRSAATSECPGAAHLCADPSKLGGARSHHETAETYSWVSTAALAAGAVGVGVGAFLLLRPSRGSSSSAAVRLSPMLSRDGGGLWLSGPL